MLYIITALFCEAQPFIQTYQLKKDPDFCSFQLFKNEQITLLVTGQGKLNSAIATSCLFSTYPPRIQDCVMNVGIAASFLSNATEGQLFLCHKIEDMDTGFDYYPDMLYQHSFLEGELYTHSKIVTSFERPGLVDMEASGFYSAAITFFSSSNIQVLKIISDIGNTSQITSESIIDQMALHVEAIVSFGQQIEAANTVKTVSYSQIETQWMEEIADQLHLSVTGKHQWNQLCYYLKLSSPDFSTILGEMKQICDNQQIKNKREGKIYFEQFKQSYL